MKIAHVFPKISLLAASTAVACALSSASASAATVTWLFDFGAGGTPTTHGAPPIDDDPVNYWNNVTDAIGTSATGAISDLITTSNVTTAVDFAIVSRFAGANGNGTTAVSIFPTDATRDSLYGNTGPFQGQSNFTPIFRFSSLDPFLTYDFKFFASRTGVTDNRETLYTVQGSVSGTAALNAANNVSSFVTVSGITPTAGGEITISLTPGLNNNNNSGDDTSGANPSRFVYLGVLEMQAIPEPSAALALSAGAMTLVARRRRYKE